jgi:hypothetical protein
LSTDANIAYIVLGSSSTTTPISLEEADNITVFEIQGPSGFGCTVRSAGDVNNDGYDDALVCVVSNVLNNGDQERIYYYPYTYTYSSSACYLFFGMANGSNINVEEEDSFDGMTITRLTGNSGIISINGIFDINGDGYADFAIDDPYKSSSAGIAYVFYGKEFK